MKLLNKIVMATFGATFLDITNRSKAHERWRNLSKFIRTLLKRAWNYFSITLVVIWLPSNMHHIYYNSFKNSRTAHWLIFIVDKRTDIWIYYYKQQQQHQQIDVSFSCFWPVIDNGFRHNNVNPLVDPQLPGQFLWRNSRSKTTIIIS